MNRLALADLLLRDAAGLLIVKATVVLALASAAAAAAQGFSAARRHVLWLVALSSCVWLAVSSPAVPAISIQTSMLARELAETAAPPTNVAHPGAGSARNAPASPVRTIFPSSRGVRPSPLQSIPLPGHPLMAVWIIGSIALFVRHAIGFVRATRLARRAFVANDDETTRELSSVAAAVGVTREIHLCYSADVPTPVTFGIAKPYVLLPTEAKSWSVARRRAVLVHEAAHIARRDCLSQAIGRLACELFWFHPLVWRAFARLRDEAERAADDCVLASGMTASEYATHLLELARRAAHSQPDLVAVGIVSTNDLERRFIAMFDSTRSRATVTSRTRAFTTTFALAAICPLASLRIDALAPSMNSPLGRAPLPHVATPHSTTVTRVPTAVHDSARISRTPEGDAAIMRRLVFDTSNWTIAVVEPPASASVAHPDFSGTWAPDSVGDFPEDNAVTDSSVIKQSAVAISFESRGYYLGVPTHNRFQTIPLDGAQSTGFVATGDQATNVVARAVWVGDTLVLKSYAQSGGHDALTYEQMTLSADGNTMVARNTSFVDGKNRWGGARTFVLRRITR